MTVAAGSTAEEVAAKRRRLLLGVIAAAVVVALPQFGWLRNEFRVLILGIALCSGLVGLSMNVLTGYAGQISLGQAALWGTGAFASAHLMTIRGLPFWVALPLGALITGGVVLIMGFPALRIRGLHLAIVTLGFQFLMNRVVFRLKFLTGGAAGIDVERPAVLGNQLDLHREFLYVIIAVIAVVWWLDRNLTRTRAGRAFLAIREDEQVASSFGIDVARYKLLAFVISGCYAGLAGGLFGTLVGTVSVETYDYQPSLEFLAYAVIGGLGSRAGTMLGAMFPIVYRQVFQGLRSWGVVLGGVLLILTLVRYRGGLAEQGRELRHLLGLAWHNRVKILRGLVRLVVLPVRIWQHRRAIPAFVRMIPHLPKLAKARREAKAASAVTHVESFSLEDVLHATVGASGLGPLSRPSRLRGGTGPLLAIHELSIRFGGVQALDGVSLEVREGEIVGLMGPNGAGKTTLFNCVSGFVKPQSGRMRARGRDIWNMPPHERAVLGFGRTFQNIGLVKSETVLSNLQIAQHTLAGYGPLEGMIRGADVQRSERVMFDRALQVIKLLGLESVGHERVHNLPHGLLKVVELGCALVTGPQVLLLDEPSSGMSPQEGHELGDTLQRIRDTFGVTIFMIEHHVPLVLAVADYVYVLNFGRILAEGEASEIASHPEVIAAYLGESDEIAEEALAAGLP